MPIGPRRALFGASRITFADIMAGAATDGVWWSFADNSLVIRDTVTPANNYRGTFFSKFTFTRASVANYFDSSGVLVQAATNEPRLNFTDKLRYLAEATRTNSLRNNTMVDAAAGTPGTAPTNWTIFDTDWTGLTCSVVGTGVEKGVEYIDLSIVGTPSGGSYFALAEFEARTQIVASNGQVWNSSYFNKLVAGTLDGITDHYHIMGEHTSAGAFVANGTLGSSIPTATLTRHEHTKTLAGGGTVARVTNAYGLEFSGAAVNCTLRIGLPQLELGVGASSVIKTSTVAVVRAADVCSMASSLFNLSQTAGTLYAKARTLSTAATVLLSLTDGTANERMTILTNSGVAGSARWQCHDGGAIVADITIASQITQNTTFKMAAYYTVNDFQTAINGTLGTQDTVGVVATTNKLCIGIRDTFTPLTGEIDEGFYIPRKMSEVELQAQTNFNLADGSIELPSTVVINAKTLTRNNDPEKWSFGIYPGAPTIYDFELRPGDVGWDDDPVGVRHRSELNGSGTKFDFGEEFWHSFAIMIVGSTAFSEAGAFFIMGQWHANADKGPPILFHYGDGSFTINTQSDVGGSNVWVERYSAALPAPGVWHNFVLNAEMSANGLLNVYLDGVQIITLPDIPLGYYNSAPGEATYLNFGIYGTDAFTKDCRVRFANVEWGTSDLSARIATPLATRNLT